MAVVAAEEFKSGFLNCWQFWSDCPAKTARDTSAHPNENGEHIGYIIYIFVGLQSAFLQELLVLYAVNFKVFHT